MAEAEEQVIVNEEQPIAEPEPTPEEPTTPEPEPAAEPEPEEEEEPEERPISRRESLRIQQLVSKLKQSQPDQQPSRDRPKSLDYAQALEADTETLNQLDADRRQYGESRYQEGLEQVKVIEFRTNLRMDAPRIEAKYPVMDKAAPQFNPVVADALNQMYLSAVGWDDRTKTVRNSDVSYADYIESQFELADELANERVARSTKNIAKQAAVTGLRPSGNSAKKLNLNQAPENMSDEELNAAIAQTIPTKR